MKSEKKKTHKKFNNIYTHDKKTKTFSDYSPKCVTQFKVLHEIFNTFQIYTGHF